MRSVFSNRRSKRGLVLATGLLLLGLAGCSGPFDHVNIEIVELRSAPRLEFLHARAGMEFIQIVFEFENRSRQELVLKALDFSIRDTSGRLFPYSAQVIYMGQPRATAEVTLEGKERRRGSVVFQIPDRATPSQLVYLQNVEGGLSISLASSD